MNAKATSEFWPDPPDSPLLRRTFHALWFTDLIAATLFFTVPYASELNPVTVFFYDVFGLLGVALAALCYAGIIVAVGAFLSDPFDIQFVGAMVVLYAMFVFNNIVLLVFREPVLDIIGI